jgi:homoserine O-succinyltransferase
MPVIVNAKEKHPFLSSLASDTSIDAWRAEHQDIRPMEVLMLNLMADKIGTEKQMAEWLGRTPLQVNLTFAATDRYLTAIRNGKRSKNTPSDHIKKYYTSLSEIRDKKFDGLIVTGTNADAIPHDLKEEKFWPEVEEILEWSKTHVLSSLFLCWGGHAALRHFHNIRHVRAPRKTWGVFDHRMVKDSTNILQGFPDRFAVPVSHWNGIAREDVLKNPALELVADSEEAGVGLIVEPRPYDDGKRLYPYRVYTLFHPEYDTETLKREYIRDRATDSAPALPAHYFPGDDPAKPPENLWRLWACIYTRWVRSIYEATPYDINLIPEPYRRG